MIANDSRKTSQIFCVPSVKKKVYNYILKSTTVISKRVSLYTQCELLPLVLMCTSNKKININTFKKLQMVAVTRRYSKDAPHIPSLSILHGMTCAKPIHSI